MFKKDVSKKSKISAKSAETIGGVVGNTNSTPPEEKQGNKAIHWLFTWNNYPENWKDILDCALSAKVIGYIYGKEIAPTTGTPHIQGYIELKEKMRWTEFKLPKQIRWMAKGKNAKTSHNIKYCGEDGDFYCSPNFKPPRELKILHPSQFFEWEKDVITILDKEPNDRTIHWFWEDDGNVGKSIFVKYICYTYNAVLCAGKNSDMKYAIVKHIERTGRAPDIVILDIPRVNLRYVSYTGIEEVKNGCFASTKFECGMVIMNSPHIICFANEEPDITTMSADRWFIRNIDGGKMTEKKTERVDINYLDVQ